MPQDDVKARIIETEELIGSCKHLSELMFSLASYQTSVSQQMLAGVATIFLPLTYIAGIYGRWHIFLPVVCGQAITWLRCLAISQARTLRFFLSSLGVWTLITWVSPRASLWATCSSGASWWQWL